MHHNKFWMCYLNIQIRCSTHVREKYKFHIQKTRNHYQVLPQSLTTKRGSSCFSLPCLEWMPEERSQGQQILYLYISLPKCYKLPDCLGQKELAGREEEVQGRGFRLN